MLMKTKAELDREKELLKGEGLKFEILTMIIVFAFVVTPIYMTGNLWMGFFAWLIFFISSKITAWLVSKL